MFEALGSLTFRLRYLIAAAWIVAAGASALLAPSLASKGTTDEAAFLPAYAPSAQAREALERAFPGATSTSSATLAFYRPTGLTESDRAYLDATAAWITGPDAPGLLRDAVTGTDSASSRPELTSMLESSDGTLELLVVNLDIGSVGDRADAVISALRDHLRATGRDGLASYVTGSAGISTDYLRAIKAGTESTTAVTVALVVIILLLIYRAPLAALVPLLTIAAAYLVARGLLGLLAAAGWSVSSLLDTFLVVLVFGVGTDYTIFLISRFREEVRGKTHWHHASKATVHRIGAVITASAATVIVGLGAMAFGDFEMIRSTGPALGVAIAVTLVAGLTLTPALLGLFGHYLFWPRHDEPKLAGEPTGFFSRLAAAVSRHPALVVVGLLVALLVPAGFLPQVRTNFDVLAELPATSDARTGFDLVSEHMGRGKVVETTGLVETAGGDMLAPAQLARLRDTMLTLQGTPGVASVTSLVTPNGDGVVPDGLKPSAQLVTIADAFRSTGSSGSAASSGSSASLLDPELSSGLADALDYVAALAPAFPDIAGRSAYRSATQAITDAQDIVALAKKQSVVATQLRSLAAALTSPASAASGGGSDSSLIANYLDELAAAYPEVRSLPAFAAATVAGHGLERTPGAGAAVAAADALDALAVYFDARPDATLTPTSLANTASALEAKRQAKAAFAAIPTALDGLAALFKGRSDDLFVPLGLGGDEAGKVRAAVDAFVSTDRAATRFYVALVDDPYSTRAFTTTRAIAAALAAAALGFGGGARASIGGATAQLADVQDVLGGDFSRVGAVTILGIVLVLVLLLRALVAPLYLVATVLVSYGSAVGLSAWLFQGVLGQPGVSFYLPLMVFVLLVALGSDYNIFLMSRVREESEARPIRDGVRIASGHTGAVITSAGLILAGTFGSMATAQLIVLFQVGVAVAVGVLIDTFVVRSILVPAITTLVGDRAWWPSGLRLAGLASAPAMLAPAERRSGPGVAPMAGLALAERERRSPRRVAVALGLAALLPATFAGLISWAQQPAGAIVRVAVVNADQGATISAADGSTRQLRLGASLASELASTATDSIAWQPADAATASAGLASERYAAVLTIPAGFSRAIAAIRADGIGRQPAATLHLQTGTATGAMSVEVARQLRAAILLSAASDATASYVDDVLLGVSTTHADIEGAADSARSIAERASSLAADASGVQRVAGELVAGLDALASGTAAAVGGTTRLATVTGQLAGSARTLADGSASLASGADSTAAAAGQLSSGVAALSTGLATLRAQTAGLPNEVSGLASGAAELSSGAAAGAAGASQLAAALDGLKTGTTGLGAQAKGLDDGAALLVAGAADLDSGATQVAAGAASLAAGADTLHDSIETYTGSVATLSANCLAIGGSAAVCDALAALVTSNGALQTAAADVASGASGLATASAGLATDVTAVQAGAATLHAGTAALAGSLPALESGIAGSADAAASLAGGSSALAAGASALAEGTQQLSDDMPALTGGIAESATGAAAAASGASSLAAGMTGVASGLSSLAAGMQRAADGAATLASGTSSSVAQADRLSDAVGQALDGAGLVRAEVGQLAAGGSSLAGVATGAANRLESSASTGMAYPLERRERIAARVANPVTVETTGPSTVQAGPLGPAGAALAPLAMGLALWLGALGAFLVLPSGRHGRRWSSVLAAFAGAAMLGLVAAGLMIAVLHVGLGLDVARLPAFTAVCLIAAVAFAAVVQALVVLFGTRGWLLALLLAAVQAAAAGYPVAPEALPGALAALHPLMPVPAAVDALRATVVGSGSIGAPIAVLVAWLAAALLLTSLTTLGAARRAAHVPAGA
jgi:RND superfamily putative drug exporter